MTGRHIGRRGGNATPASLLVAVVALAAVVSLLGLSLSYGIVKQLGGSIDLKSKVGEGTEVTIALPK